MNKVIFTTTDGYPVSIGDRYHIIDEGGIQHWKCDEDDPIPTQDTYKEYLNAQDVKMNSDMYPPYRWQHVNITEEIIKDEE